MAETLLLPPEERGNCSISRWYKGKSVFITGATGFMGKVLIEKLLYQCPEIKEIYIFLRSKRGRSPEQRIADMFKLPMFQRLKKVDPDAIKKIKSIHGDIIQENLGLSTAEQSVLTENVSVIFHCAATLKLEAPLKDAIEMNTAGTEKILELAKKTKHLKALVHLSTAFCSADLPEFREKVYPCPDNPKDVIQVVRWMRDDALVKATPAIIHPHPNTYTYSKRLAETLVASEYPNLPVVIVRPSIVTPAGVEPLPGWVDTLNGPMGLMVAAGKGVIRSMHVKGENRAQVVPVDLAINGIISAAWKIGTIQTKPKEIPVYNMTQDAVKKVTWKEVLDTGRQVGHEYPFEMQIWYPDGDIRSSKLMHQICCIFLHWIPAYFIDFLLFVFRQKRFMVRLMHKINDGLELLQFFTTREWIFDSTNFLALAGERTPEDKKAFLIDFNIMTPEEYMKLSVLGTRQYCMKEDLSTIPRCRRIQKVLYIIDRLFALFFYMGLIWLLCSFSDTAKSIFDSVGKYAKNVPVVGSLVPTS
ncbi:putative fatty acyl-CoA reductase CG5065 isoform X2 [Agrilus planipennis]|nr:putative fatty acyl-CoA reductase CG5065 isoform X2 [Agrilus planipennis]